MLVLVADAPKNEAKRKAAKGWGRLNLGQGRVGDPPYRRRGALGGVLSPHRICSESVSAGTGWVNPMNDDAILLRRYVEERSEDAFTHLVEKYVDLVYSAALRRTGGRGHHAADVVQDVFTSLAQQARTLCEHPALGAWLHTTTRNVALNLMRAENRRQQRQHAALDLETVQSGTTSPEWERVRPAIDAAIDELPEPDRMAVVLRFLERRGFREIGAALAVSEDAARMRTERALEKLRALLERRGITSTSAALGAAVSAHATVTAPAGLAATVATQSVAAGAGLLAGFAGVMSVKTLATAGVSALIAFAVGMTFAGGRPATAAAAPVVALVDPTVRAENQRLKDELARLSAEMSTLRAANARLLAEKTAADARPPQRLGVSIGKPKHEIQRDILNNLRQIAAARDQYALENKRQPESLVTIVGSDAYIRRVSAVDGEDYRELSMQANGALTVTTASGLVVTYDPDGGTTTPVEDPPELKRVWEIEAKVQDSVRAARESYRLANKGKDPPNQRALLPYFATPQEGADFDELLEARAVASRAEEYRAFVERKKNQAGR